MQVQKSIFRIFTPKLVIYPGVVFFILFTLSSLLQAMDRNNSLMKHSNETLDYYADFQPPEDDYYDDDYLRHSDFVYVNNIKSVLFNRKGWELSSPIIEFNSAERLVLQFDDLDGDYKNYSYTIIHCDATWQPSDLMEHEYIEGFYEDRLNEYSFSRNTRVAFTHYTLEFPNANMQPKLSGNYILKVFVDGDKDQVVLTRRFMVFEQRVTVEATVKQATNLDYRDTSQEIDFTVNTSLYPVSNPYRDLKVLITQNGRWDNAIYGLQPRLVQGDMLVYDYEDKNVFQGGNEFRNFDIKSLRHRSLNVDEINPVTNGWEVHLRPDRNRRFLRYTSRDDINGKLIVKTDDYADDFLESDYAWVHFSLPSDKPLTDGDVYVMGELTDWRFNSRNKMEYNYRDARYELRMLLKQGFYDYKYIYLEDGTDTGDESLFEGSHSITENEYAIYIYYRKPGDIYDSLIGVQHIHSEM